METNGRVTVDFDEESYYLDGKYWESWDNFGEELADAINREFEKQEKEIKKLKEKIKEYQEFIDEVWRKYEEAHGLSIENSDWY